jgi:pimeloyl-ACP methyl ester carboxylesterase
VNDPYLIAPSNNAAKEMFSSILRDNPQDLSNNRDHWKKRSVKEPSLRRLSEIHIPTLILVGESDIPDVHAQAGALQAGIAGSRRIVVAGSGHLIHLEKPAEFVRQIDELAASADQQSPGELMHKSK